MADLAVFRWEVRQALRAVGRTQQRLARSVGMHPGVLSRKLNGAGESFPAIPDVLAIVRTLVEWSALTTTEDVDRLLETMAVPHRLVSGESWYSDLSGTPTTRAGRAAPVPTHETSVLVSPVAPPRPITPFIGREAVVAAVSAMVRDTRLVTLTGIGGTGKSRVALAVAATLGPGSATVSRSPTSLPSPPPPCSDRRARLVGAPSVGRVDVEQQLIEALREANLLLLVDNLEHLVEASDVLGRLLTAAPDVHILATSRVPLHIYGEQQFRVPPLTLPEDTGATESGIRDSEAVQLFLQRARAVQSGLSPQGEALRAVADICSALDGVPLSIDSPPRRRACGRPRPSRTVSSSCCLPHRRRPGPARPSTEHAGHHRVERGLARRVRTNPFRARLGVFAGSFDLAAAGAVTGQEAFDLGRSITTFVEHSLIEMAVPSADGWTSIPDAGVDPAVRPRPTRAARPAPRCPAVPICATSPTWSAGLETPGVRSSSGDLDRLEADDANVNAALSWVCDLTTPWIPTASLTGCGWRARLLVCGTGVRRSPTAAPTCRHCWTPRPASSVPVAVRATALLRSAMLATSGGDFRGATAFAAECLRTCSAASATSPA